MAFGFGFGLPRMAPVPLEAAIAGLLPDVWYDPSDISTLYQDSAGTTPVTAVEQPVGLMLDKSKGLVLGPELVTNGDFSNGTTGWSNVVSGTPALNQWGVVSGVLRGNRPAGAAIVAGVVPESNKTYRVQLQISSYTRGGVYLEVQGARSFSFKAAGTYTCYVMTAGGTPDNIRVLGENLFEGDVDNISVRELPGNHAYHTPGDTTTRPVVSRRINLLTKTEQFDDAAWTKVGTASATSSTSLSFPAVNDYAFEGVSASSVAGRSMTVSMKLSGSGTIALGFYDNVSGFQTTTIALTATPTTYTTTKTIGAGAVDVRILVGRIGAATATSITTTQASLVPADLAALPYQRVNTTTDYDTSSVFPTFLRTDGVNDSLQTNAINFSATDKMFVSAGVRKLSDANTGMFLELSANGDSNSGTFQFDSPDGSNGKNIAFYSKGTINSGAISGAAYVAPISMVATGIGNISAPSSVLRVNGAQAAQSTATQGTGNYGSSYPLYLFRRGGSSLPFNGWFYGSVIAGKTLTAAQVSTVERYMAQKTKTVSIA